MRLTVGASNVRTSEMVYFDSREREIDVRHIMASGALPPAFPAVRIDGELYWDGGYVGNPAIYPLIYNCNTRDVVIVHINPIIRKGVPRTAGEIAFWRKDRARPGPSRWQLGKDGGAVV